MPPEAGDAIVVHLRAAGCVFAEQEAALLEEAAGSPAELEELVARRVGGEPLEYVLGFAEFAGLRIGVEPGVFVPRRRTELLARQAIAYAKPGSVVVDLCCGSGAIGAAIADAVPGVELYAADLDPVAVRCARGNLAGIGRVYAGDLFGALPSRLRGRIDVLAVNTPYVPTDAIATMPPEARDHEPALALDGGTDGLHVQRRVAAGASWLRPGGRVCIESSERQAPALASVFAAYGLTPETVRDDDLGGTVVTGVRPARAGS